MKICPYCSNEIVDNAKMCTHCGMKLKENIKESKQETKQKTKEEEIKTPQDMLYEALGFEKIGPLNKKITLFLAIPLGIFGIHKLYERKYIMFVLYLCTLGLFGVGVVIDVLNLLNKPNKYYVYKQRL